jgi:hypothetical protein
MLSILSAHLWERGEMKKEKVSIISVANIPNATNGRYTLCMDIEQACIAMISECRERYACDASTPRQIEKGSTQTIIWGNESARYFAMVTISVLCSINIEIELKNWDSIKSRVRLNRESIQKRRVLFKI